jgi:hypothetical protein
VTNAVKASQALGHLPPVWLGLAGNERHVFIGVWDGNVESGQTSVAGDDELPDLEAEGGRGLLLVDSLSADWGVYWPEDSHGKVVWSVVTDPEAPYRNRVFTSRISRIVAETGALSSPRYAASTGYGRACDSCASAGRA